MTRGAKMFMVANARNRSNRGGNREGQMNNEMRGNYGMESNQGGNRMENEMRGGYGMESNYDMESRLRDRRGREHYDNGRFAPMRSEMREGYGVRSNYDMDSRFRDNQGRERYDDGRFAPQANGARWLPPYYDVDINRYEYEIEEPESNGTSRYGGSQGRQGSPRSNYTQNRGGQDMRMIGFERGNEMRMGGSDASIRRYQEMDRMQGNRAMPGGAHSQHMPQFDEEMAMEWTSSMENADGTHGPHWSMEQLEKIMKDKKINMDPVQFFAAVNMIYSDYVEVAKKRNLNTMDFYTDMAKAFLEDKDAGAKDKLAAYYEYVVKG